MELHLLKQQSLALAKTLDLERKEIDEQIKLLTDKKRMIGERMIKEFRKAKAVTKKQFDKVNDGCEERIDEDGNKCEHLVHHGFHVSLHSDCKCI